MSRKRKFEETICELTNDQTSAILCADEYAIGIEKYGSQDVPAKLTNKCYGGSTRRRHINFSKASKIVLEWQISGIPDRARSYLSWNHPEMTGFLDAQNIRFNEPSTTQDSTCDTSSNSADNDSDDDAEETEEDSNSSNSDDDDEEIHVDFEETVEHDNGEDAESTSQGKLRQESVM